jgi:hypothetical protein
MPGKGRGKEKREERGGEEESSLMVGSISVII